MITRGLIYYYQSNTVILCISCEWRENGEFCKGEMCQAACAAPLSQSRELCTDDCCIQ